MKIKLGKIQRTILWNFIKKFVNSVGSKILLMLDIAGWIASLFPKFSLNPLIVLVFNVVILVGIGTYVIFKQEYVVIEKPMAILLEHTYFINAMVLSLDEGKMISCGGDNYAILWDIIERKVLRRIPHDGWVSNVAFSPDGAFVFSVNGKTGMFTAWEVSTGKLINKHPHPNKSVSRGLVVDPYGKRVLISSKDGSINSFDPLDSHFYSMPVQISDVELRRICISDEGLIATANIQGEIFLIGKNDQGEYQPKIIYQDKNKEMIRNLIFTKDNSNLAFTDSGGYIKVIELATNRVVSIKAHNGHAIAIAFSPDDRYLATGGQDNVISIWKFNSHSLRKEFEIHGHSDDVICLAFDRNEHLYSASRDCSIKIWNLNGLY